MSNVWFGVFGICSCQRLSLSFLLYPVTLIWISLVTNGSKPHSAPFLLDLRGTFTSSYPPQSKNQLHDHPKTFRVAYPGDATRRALRWFIEATPKSMEVILNGSEYLERVGFEIIEAIARGGQAIVYKAQYNHQLVAAKVYNTGQGNSTPQHFFDEKDILSY